MNRITVLLADDHTIVRNGLRRLLESEADIEITGEAEDGREAVALALELEPDVIVMDIAMPHLNGLEATRRIRTDFPAARIIILSAYGDDDHVKQFVRLGAAGYLVKQTSAQDLARAIREVRNGKTFFSQPIASRLKHLFRKSPNGPGKAGKEISLSPRETEVLQLIAEGSANKQISAELAISIKTVEKHRQHLMEKLNIHDTAGLTRYALAAGIIETGVQNTAE